MLVARGAHTHVYTHEGGDENTSLFSLSVSLSSYCSVSLSHSLPYSHSHFVSGAGLSTLASAAIGGSDECVSLLLSLGHQPSDRYTSPCSSWSAFLMKRSMLITRRDNAGRTALFHACSAGQIATTRALVNVSDPNMASAEGGLVTVLVCISCPF
jgi:ankyrin repeat protein